MHDFHVFIVENNNNTTVKNNRFYFSYIADSLIWRLTGVVVAGQFSLQIDCDIPAHGHGVHNRQFRSEEAILDGPLPSMINPEHNI